MLLDLFPDTGFSETLKSVYRIFLFVRFVFHMKDGGPLPSAHVFEGMRIVMFENRFALDHFAAAAVLDLVYLGLGGAAFLYAFQVARRRGALLQQGE